MSLGNFEREREKGGMRAFSINHMKSQNLHKKYLDSLVKTGESQILLFNLNVKIFMISCFLNLLIETEREIESINKERKLRMTRIQLGINKVRRN